MAMIERTPVSTYRMQFHAGFRFVDAQDLVPYLNDLGITDLYSSPRFSARRGSSHGYDVVDPHRINSELGTERDFDDLAGKLRHYGMGLLLDIVPNHMAAAGENPWWRDVLENGPASQFAFWFDIDWHPATSKAAFLQDNRVLLPILGGLYGHVLANQELTLKIEDIGFYVRYYEHKLPLDPRSGRHIFEQALRTLEPETAPAQETAAILADLEELPAYTETEPQRIAIRRREKGRIQQRIWKAYIENGAIRQAVDDAMRVINGNKQDPASFDLLDRILSEQPYRIAHWKIGYEEINYRRFFDINQLTGLRVELPEVFRERHCEELKLVAAGKVTGLRIDHVDGLYDPLGYLQRLRDTQRGRDLYVVVEKVLGRNEELPHEWPVAGTTGYDFLNAANGVQIDPFGLAALERSYAWHTGNEMPFAELCYACNKKVMRQLFPGEVNRFGHDLGELAAHDREARDIPLSELMDALVEVTACLPIYRTYIRDFDIPPRDREYLERTLHEARRRTPPERIGDATFVFLRRVLLLDPPYYLENQKEAWQQFVMRWQQFTGPVMGKGLEDTAFYIHNSLISRNEVGNDALRLMPPVDVAGFHRFNQRRRELWPDTLNATSTHDTKRSEDTRARINVLSEIPDEWEVRLNHWMRLNETARSVSGGAPVPDVTEEILIYQTLLGVWPIEGAADADLAGRMKSFVVKAVREAKRNSSWVQPNEAYEQQLQAFVEGILALPAFLENFAEFQARIAFHGAFNGLAQVLLKIASPGVPDFYQGAELWDFHIVDPDNRRPVDYPKRIALLESLRRKEAEDRGALIRGLVDNWREDGLKLFVTSKGLEHRRAHRDLFREGEYLPLVAEGEKHERVLAFARRSGEQWAVVAVPRLSVGLGYTPPDMRNAQWGGTVVRLPEGAPSRWMNVFTCAELDAAGRLPLAELFREMPVALLEGV